MTTTSKSFMLEVLTGPQVAPYFEDIVRIRGTVFREYPYFYESDLELEKRYLEGFLKNESSVLILVKDSETQRVIGASLASPLKAQFEEYQQTIAQSEFNIDEVYFCSDSAILPEYRGMGIGKQFFKKREAIARANPQFKYIATAGIDQSTLKQTPPPNYIKAEALWQKLGYTRRPDLVSMIAWKCHNETKSSPKPMVFWIKKL